jgi:hypothetical protein
MAATPTDKTEVFRGRGSAAKFRILWLNTQDRISKIFGVERKMSDVWGGQNPYTAESTSQYWGIRSVILPIRCWLWVKDGADMGVRTVCIG